MGRTTIVVPDGLQEQAKELGVNVSEECRRAVAQAVEAAKEAKRLGDDFEQVRARQAVAPGREGEADQSVEFFGHLVFVDESMDVDYYVTAGGNAAWIDADGYLWWTDDVSELEPGPAYQELCRALGEAPEPTFLDI